MVCRVGLVSWCFFSALFGRAFRAGLGWMSLSASLITPLFSLRFFRLSLLNWNRVHDLTRSFLTVLRWSLCCSSCDRIRAPLCLCILCLQYLQWIEVWTLKVWSKVRLTYPTYSDHDSIVGNIFDVWILGDCLLVAAVFAALFLGDIIASLFVPFWVVICIRPAALFAQDFNLGRLARVSGNLFSYSGLT